MRAASGNAGTEIYVTFDGQSGFPLPEGSPTALTAVKVTQYLSDDVVIFGGKFNMLDELIQPFGAGRGVDAFMNTGLVFPVVLERTVPYSTLGAGFAILSGSRAVFTLMAFDPQSEKFVVDTQLRETRGAVRHMVFHADARALWFGTDTGELVRVRIP